MRYGTAFKDYLLRTFRLRGMIGFQSQIFPDVLVRPVMILAEKRADVRARVRDGRRGGADRARRLSTVRRPRLRAAPNRPRSRPTL